MSENNCAVYAHVNLINGKKYFGITIQEPEARWGKDGKGYSRNEHFTNAINKYGWENFGHFVLYKNIPIKIAKNIEEMLILKHMSYDPRFGYNKTMGGELERHSDETRRKMSKNNAMKRPEERRKVSEAKKEFYKNHPEAREKMSKPVEAIDPKTGERVFCFESTRDAERAGFGFDHGHIGKCCNRKSRYKTHKGYIWRYVEEVDDNGSDN